MTIQTDLSDYVISRVFSQIDDNRLVYPITFFLKNLNFTKYKYKIYNNKLLAITRYFE